MALRALLLTLIMCFFASLVYADFKMTPGVDLHLEYNDNIYLDSENEEDDFITTVSPNVSLDWETSRLDVSLYASVTMEKYMDNTDEDRIGAGESTQASSLDALARLYREIFFLRVSDSYRRVPIDEGGRGGEDNRTINLTDSNQFQVNPYLQFQLMKDTRMQVGYTYENLWYEKDEGDDAINHLYSASLTQELSARVSLSLSGSYKEYRPKSPDKAIVVDDGGAYEYDQESVNVGLSYQATDRLQLNGQYGHTWLDYSVRSDSDSDTWSAGADYELSSDYTAGIQYSNNYVVSVEDGPSETDHLMAYLAYDDRFKLKFSLFTNNSSYVEINREDDSYGGELSGELPFNEKVGVTGLFRYTNFDQSGLDAEEYDRYSTKLAVYYETRLGRVSAGYIYNRSDSDLSDGDYTNNIVFIDASLRF
jgi:hypothetical protein